MKNLLFVLLFLFSFNCFADTKFYWSYSINPKSVGNGIVFDDTKLLPFKADWTCKLNKPKQEFYQGVYVELVIYSCYNKVKNIYINDVVVCFHESDSDSISFVDLDNDTKILIRVACNLK